MRRAVICVLLSVQASCASHQTKSPEALALDRIRNVAQSDGDVAASIALTALPPTTTRWFTDQQLVELLNEMIALDCPLTGVACLDILRSNLTLSRPTKLSPQATSTTRPEDR